MLMFIYLYNGLLFGYRGRVNFYYCFSLLDVYIIMEKFERYIMLVLKNL